MAKSNAIFFIHDYSDYTNYLNLEDTIHQWVNIFSTEKARLIIIGLVTLAPYLQRVIIYVIAQIESVFTWLFMWRFFKYQLVNVHKHKVNCFHRFVNRFIIDSCSSLIVTKHAYQRNYISPLFLVNLLPSDFKINIHNCINIYMCMYIIFDGNFFLTLYLHIKP